ncbi:MAPEG family protein [Rhizobiaceae bacterium]|nr:MAPEG family protein [Rhizobiaceae bacterium]
MVLPITTFATLALAGLYIVLTMRVIDARRAAGVSIGDGGDALLSRRMRGQANFTENVPITLLVMVVTELQTVTVLPNAFSILFALAAVAFVLGRVLHGCAFCFSDNWPFGRMGGMLLTFGSMIVLILLAIFAVLA